MSIKLTHTLGPNHKIQAVLASGVGQRLVELLSHSNSTVVTPALRTVGNIVTGDESQTQMMINFSALSSLKSLLSSAKKSIRKETCWTISNVTAGSAGQIQSVLDAQIFSPLLELLATGEFDVRKEAAWAISNATSGGTPEQIQHLVQQGCIPPLCDLLEVSDAKVITVALEGLENILKLGENLGKQNGSGVNDMATIIDEVDGISKIQQLQYHEHEDIYERTVKLVETYFGIEEEHDADIAPGHTGAQFNFGTNDSQSSSMFNFGNTSGNAHIRFED